MKRSLVYFLTLLVLVACGKNDGVRTVGNYNPAPVVNAPAPSGGGGGYSPTGPSFRPTMPSGMPPQFVPFLPIYNYTRRSPQLQNFWYSLWNQWIQYAQYRGYQRYNFAPFWTEFCPQVLTQNYSNFYNAFDYSFYYWVTPQTQISSSVDTSFWSYYDYYSYSSIDSYGYCGDCY